MAKTSTSTARRREVRKSVPRRYDSALQRLRDRQVLWAALYALLLAAAAVAVVEWLGGVSRYRQDQVLDRPIVARVAFEYENAEQTRLRREQAARSVFNIYVPSDDYRRELEAKLDNLLASRNELSDRDLPPQARQRLDGYVRDGEPLPQWRQDKQQFLRGMFNDLVILDQAEYQRELENLSRQRITVQLAYPPADGEPTRVSTPADFFSVEDLEKLDENVRIVAQAFRDDALQEVIVRLVMREPRPTYKFDPQLTERRREEAQQAVQPEFWEQKANEVMVPAGKPLDDRDLKLIRREWQEYRAQTPASLRLGQIGGLFGAFLLLAGGMWVYIFAYQHKVMRNAMRGLAITLLLLLCHALAVAFARSQPQFFHLLVTFPPVMVTMVLAIAYDQRFALGIGAVACGVTALSIQADAGFALVLLAGVGTAVALLREVRTHSKIVSVGLWSGLAMGAATLAVALGTRTLILDGALTRIWRDGLLATLGGIGASLLVQAVLPLIERAFKVTTAMKLRELTDVSHPLLQRLAQEAPGTYQHSLRIADMAEAAAEAIGVDGLLCRVGAMYHDIGKTNKPQYFIENQGGGPNRHAKLSPAMSLLIIVGHVKDGVEMAREYGLPPEIRHFIESHHGTTLVEYFYHAARKQKEAEAEEAPSEFEFRYPGPKPQTKEAAIMLLCDSVEAAARVIDEPTPIRIEQLVDKMATKRLMDNQFDECNLTLAELHVIQQSITKTLCAIYHSRIKYPGQKKPEQPPADQPAAQPQSA